MPIPNQSGALDQTTQGAWSARQQKILSDIDAILPTGNPSADGAQYDNMANQSNVASSETHCNALKNLLMLAFFKSEITKGRPKRNPFEIEKAKRKLAALNRLLDCYHVINASDPRIKDIDPHNLTILGYTVSIDKRHLPPGSTISASKRLS